MEKEKAKRWYFWLIIVITGSLGIWLPLCELGIFPIEAIALSIMSYAVVIFVTSATDWGIRKIAEKQATNLLKCLAVPMMCFIGVYVISKLLAHKFIIWSIAISFVGMIASWVFWWKVESLDKYSANSALGGDIK